MNPTQDTAARTSAPVDPLVLAVSTNHPHGLDLAFTPQETLFSLLDDQHRRSDLLAAVLGSYTYLHEDFVRIRSANFLNALETFPEGEFEAFHLSFLSGVFPTACFPRLLAALKHLCGADERLYWVEGALPCTTSPACETLIRLTTRAMQQQRGGLPLVMRLPESRPVKLLARMEYVLRQAGYTHLVHRSILMNVAAGTALHRAFALEMLRFSLRVRESLLLLKGYTLEDYYALEAQMQREVADPNFLGDCMVYLLCAQPLLEEQPN